VKRRTVLTSTLSAIILTAVFTLGMLQPAQAMDAKTLDRLERIIQQQQTQIEAQQKAIEDLRQQVEELKTAPPPETAAAKPEAEKLTVTAGTTKANVQLYGQVNRGVLVVDDGEKTRGYQVDNDNSSTRIGLLGAANPGGEFEIGTRIEVQFESNSSSEINQIDNTDVGPDNFTKRWLDLYLKHERFGKLFVGYGSTASDGTSEVDFSGTDVVGYASVSDAAGGFFWHDSSVGDLDMDTTIGAVFTDMDGLGRKNRIRYDSPGFYGLMAATSWINNGGGDIALKYASEFGSFKLAAQAAYANPDGTSDTLDNQFNGSASILHDSGLNFTLSGGVQDYKGNRDDDGTFLYGKLGYKLNVCPLGMTALSIDGGLNKDVQQDGDEATTFGAQMVQNFTDWATEFYLGYRFYKLDRDDADYDNFNSLLTGFRVKF
jgi:cell division protein FtsB